MDHIKGKGNVYGDEDVEEIFKEEINKAISDYVTRTYPSWVDKWCPTGQGEKVIHNPYSKMELKEEVPEAVREGWLTMEEHIERSKVIKARDAYILKHGILNACENFPTYWRELKGEENNE